MALEIERKYLNADLDAVREGLSRIKATHEGAHFESNVVFDTQDDSLFRKGKLLRLRRQYWRDKEVILLTLKCKAAAKLDSARYKARLEFETEIGDLEEMISILHNLGYKKRVCYEKFRDCWHAPLKAADRSGAAPGGSGFAKFFLDILPFGQVVEKECEKDSIDCLDSQLGLDKLEISVKSYYDLHKDWCMTHGLEPTPGFAFDPESKKRFLDELEIFIHPHDFL